MDIEYEATFPNVTVTEARARFTRAGATLVRPRFTQKRAVFHLPAGHEIAGGWARVRDEGDKVTLSIKVVDGTAMTDQKEACVTVSSFDEACTILTLVGCRKKAYQETRRELWVLDDVEVTLDEWPFLAPFVEIEGKGEAAVRRAAERLGFAWAEARFCHVGTLYAEAYGIPERVFNDETPLLLFVMENPFAKR